MKRLFFVLMTLISLSSCSVDDDAPNTTFELAEITGNNLPDEFIFGDTYNVTVDYILPSECNTFSGISAQRGGNSGESRREIYVGAVTSFINSNNCDEETPGNEGSGSFPILIDETEEYTFYFWTGVDSSNEPVYTEVVVPVVETGTAQN